MSGCVMGKHYFYYYYADVTQIPGLGLRNRRVKNGDDSGLQWTDGDWGIEMIHTRLVIGLFTNIKDGAVGKAMNHFKRQMAMVHSLWNGQNATTQQHIKGMKGSNLCLSDPV